MYKYITFHFREGIWTVILPETDRAQAFGRAIDKATRSRIVRLALKRFADGLTIQTVYE